MFRLIGSRGASPFTTNGRSSGRRRSGRGGDAGFTLFEVLVAFAILAVMLVPILQVFGGGLGITATARGYAEAALLARSKLAELTAEKLQEGESSGSFDERGYRWQASVTADYSDVTLPDNTIVGVPVRPGQHERRSPGASATSEGRSRFGEGRSASGSSTRRSLFGQNRSSVGRTSGSASSRSRSGSSLGSSRTGSAAQPGIGGGEEEEGDETTQFIPYRVAVTVEWGDTFSGSGAVTLTTLRLVQPNAPDAQ